MTGCHLRCVTTWKQSAALGISKTSFQRILHIDLNLHPYKLAVAEKLNPDDPELIINYCNY